MLAIISGIIAVSFYLLATWFQVRHLQHGSDQRSKLLVCGGIAILAHLLNMVQIINTAAGYDFSFFKVATLFSFTISLLVYLSSLRKPLENLLLPLFPLAVVSILCATFLPSTATPQADYTAGVLSHIVLAILATSIITIAAFQALLLFYQHHQLRHHHAAGLTRHLPPLQTMEALLFEVLWAGLLLLSGVIATGILFMEDFLGQHLSHKTVLSLVSWFLFAILLWGRHQLGWRGRTAIRWTLSGFIFLVLAYFGSKFVLEVLLGRL